LTQNPRWCKTSPFSLRTTEGRWMNFTLLPHRWVNAAVVFVQQRAVSRHARETEQSRETIYRDARQVAQELQEGQRERLTLERRNQELEAENVRLRQQTAANPFEDQDKVFEFAATAQAEGVSLPVAQRLLTILQATARPR
jgi:hypothetical protein